MIDTTSIMVTIVTAIDLESIGMTNHIMMIVTLDIMETDTRITNILMRRSTMSRDAQHTLNKMAQKSSVLSVQV